MGYTGECEGVTGGTSDKQKPRLLDEVRRCLRLKHYSSRTEQAYVGWIRRFILVSGTRHPREMGGPEVERFLTGLAAEGRVSAGTQNQALSALLFLYRQVLAIDLPWLDNVVRAKRTRRVPVVLSQSEVQRLLAVMDGRPAFIAALLYGTGLRLMECLRLRVKDVDFARAEITVREGKGGKDRRTVLLQSLVDTLQREIARAKALHDADLAEGFGEARLPFALARKYARAARDFGWQFVFPSVQRSRDPLDGVMRRHHFDEAILARALKRRRAQAGILKPVTAHTLRHCFATHLLDAGYDIRTIAAPAHPCARGIGTSLCGTGTAWSQGCEYDANLYARAQSRWPRGAFAAGSVALRRCLRQLMQTRGQLREPQVGTGTGRGAGG
jgi:integron integrase